LIVAALLIPQVTGARGNEPCTSGRFLPTTSVPAPGGVPLAAIGFDAGGTIMLDGCGTTAVTLRAGKKATRFRARWTPCGDRPRLRLRARILAPDCRELRGRLRGTDYPSVAITALRSTCGDGRLDAGGEQCDPSATGGDVACPDACGTPTSATPCSCTSIDPTPRDLTAVIAASDVLLTWTPPAATSGFTAARLLRRLDTPPTDPGDPEAVLLFTGSATAAVDAVTALLPDTPETPRTYHYAVFACIPGGACESTGSRTTLVPTLMQALAAGGYVVHWRHASATVCVDDLALGPAATTTSPDWWKSCETDCLVATARQLNSAGRTEATTIGTVLRARGVPFGRVITSEFCRNVETATLMALGPVPEESPAITYFVYDEGNRCASANALLAEPPAPGTNTALIGHAGFAASCPVLGELAWGEGAVFKPDGAGGSMLVTRVSWDGWSGLP
jgi:hypothetical protein